MKKLLFVVPVLLLFSCGNSNNPLGAKINDRGCVECDEYFVGDVFTLRGVTYTVADRNMLLNAIDSAGNMIGNTADLGKFCTSTSKVTDMRVLFFSGKSVYSDISSWDVSNVTSMYSMFNGATSFNRPIGNWDVSNVIWMGLSSLTKSSKFQPRCRRLGCL